VRLRAHVSNAFSIVRRVPAERVSVNGPELEVVHSPEVVYSASSNARTLLVVDTGGTPTVYKAVLGKHFAEAVVPLSPGEARELGHPLAPGAWALLHVRVSSSGFAAAYIREYEWDNTVGGFHLAGVWAADVEEALEIAASALSDTRRVLEAASAAARRNAARAAVLLTRNGPGAAIGLVEPVRVWSETSGLAWRGATRHLALRRHIWASRFFMFEAIDTWAPTNRILIKALATHKYVVAGTAARYFLEEMYPSYAAHGLRDVRMVVVEVLPSSVGTLYVYSGGKEVALPATHRMVANAVKRISPVIGAMVARLELILGIDKALKTMPAEELPEKLVKQGARIKTGRSDKAPAYV